MDTTDENRPDPDELLASLQDQEEKSKHGRLKIFFGMCAGVGKTYTMLQTGQAEKIKGKDVAIGYIETHNRKETAQLVEGFEVIPRKQYEYKGAPIQEMDLDAILQRKPEIVLVDELPHTNAPGSRHLKRFQDILEILESGINVYTSLNVQHLESRSETVAQITGITVRETVPDAVFENADEVELIDITSEELLQRLSEGKVYAQERTREAVENFFRKGNITALREMALRLMADRVDKQLHAYMQEKHIKGPWKSGLHFVVAIDYSLQSAKLLRWAKNLSYSVGANVQAVYIETLHKMSNKEREQLDRNIKLTRQLGIKFRIITNRDIVKGLVGFAMKENATHILIGKPRIRNMFSMYWFGNFVNRLVRYSGNIDVYILGYDKRARDDFKERFSIPAFTSGIGQYFKTAFLIIVTAMIGYSLNPYAGYQVVSFGLLFTVSILALFYGTGPILLAATLSALIWDFFFIPPRFTLHVEEPVDMLMLVMFFIIALLNGILTSRVRAQEKRIRIREERTEALYQLVRDLNLATGLDAVAETAVNYVKKYFGLNCAILLKDKAGELKQHIVNKTDLTFSANEWSIIQWTFRHSDRAGKYTDTLPSTEYTFYPLQGHTENMGVIAVKHPVVFTQGESEFWDTGISQISGKLEREYLRNAARKTYLLTESDKLYKTLFNSISHGLRNPAATIMSASKTLLAETHSPETQSKLYTEINTASVRLNRLIENLLNMSRLESGHISFHPGRCDVHDLAAGVVAGLQDELKPFRTAVVIPPNMPPVCMDAGLMEQALHYLVLNAAQHSPAGTVIRIKFYCDSGFITIQVMDRGTALAETEQPSLFNKFYRGKEIMAGETGLTFSIVKGFVEAHQGTVTAENRKNGGALFTIKIPVKPADGAEN